MSEVRIGTIPLDEQLRRFEANWMREVRRLEADLKRPTYLQHIHDLGLARLRDGFAAYGDEMYRWTAQRLDAEMAEELADFVVYGTSED